MRRRAVRVLHARPGRRRARPARAGAAARPTWRSARRWPATCAAAPATRRSSTRSGWPRDRQAQRMSTDARTTTATTHHDVRPGRIGDSPLRPDGTLKVTGEFAYASDLWHDEMAWGVTLRSPHPHARIRAHRHHRGAHRARRLGGAHRRRRPGRERLRPRARRPAGAGLGVRPLRGRAGRAGRRRPPGDRPPRGRSGSASTTRCCRPVTDAAPGRWTPTPRPCTGPATWCGTCTLRRGEPRTRRRRSSSSLDFEVGMQDQAFLGPESGLAVPAEDGGVDLYVATQWLHVDQRQICLALGLPPEKVRLTLAGVGGAFGGREDLSMHVHACLLALRTGKPVKMSYGREESFFGHVHRHPATMTYEFGAERDGTLVYAKARILLDGGAYASSTSAVVGNAGTLGLGPVPVPVGRRRRLRRLHQQPAVRRHARVRLRAGRVRARGADGRAGRHRGRGPGRDPAAQRHARGRPQHHRAGHRLRGAGRRAAADRGRPAAAARAATADPDLRTLPGAVGQHHPRRGRRPRHRLRRRPTRTSASPRASTTTRPPGCGWR